MAKRSRRTQIAKPLVQIVHLDPRFTPEGPADEEQRTFTKFWIAACDRGIDERTQRLRRKGGARKKVVHADDDLARCRQLLEMEKTVWSVFEELGNATLAGDAGAAEALLNQMIRACQWFHIIERKRPELFASHALAQWSWPVLASHEPGWEKEAAQHITALNLGAHREWMKVRFRTARGTDANLPARRWAKAAVRVLEAAKGWALVVGGLIEDFGSAGALAEFCVETGWNVAERRSWTADAAKLPGFSSVTMGPWKSVIRQMIREDMPDFHLRPEWENQRRTGAASGRDSVGEIQNAILDDIVSALARLAPQNSC
jgi:hypothetical protein